MKYDLLALKDDKGITLALFAENRLVEYYPPSSNHAQSGDIYRAKVERIVPGLNAAFVNLGKENGFIYSKEALLNKKIDHKNCDINSVLKVGQEIIVQVTKEALGDKRPTLTAQIALAGEFLVLLPYSDEIGISRKIIDEKQKTHLLKCAGNIKRSSAGFILRTNSINVTEEMLQKEYDLLLSKWQQILNNKTSSRLLYKAGDQLESLRHDLSSKLSKVWTNDEEIYYDWQKVSSVPIFLRDREYLLQKFPLESELNRAWQKKIKLECGGFIIIEQTEAMVVIDVNSGNFSAKEGLEETFTQTNIQAAWEIAHQIRLRNLGGIIIIDFVDMVKDENRLKVTEALAEAIKSDRRKIILEGWSNLGLFELTRQKKGLPLSENTSIICPHCLGTGRIKNV